MARPPPSKLAQFSWNRIGRDQRRDCKGFHQFNVTSLQPDSEWRFICKDSGPITDGSTPSTRAQEHSTETGSRIGSDSPGATTAEANSRENPYKQSTGNQSRILTEMTDASAVSRILRIHKDPSFNPLRWGIGNQESIPWLGIISGQQRILKRSCRIGAGSEQDRPPDLPRIGAASFLGGGNLTMRAPLCWCYAGGVVGVVGVVGVGLEPPPWIALRLIGLCIQSFDLNSFPSAQRRWILSLGRSCDPGAAESCWSHCGDPSVNQSWSDGNPHQFHLTVNRSLKETMEEEEEEEEEEQLILRNPPGFIFLISPSNHFLIIIRFLGEMILWEDWKA